MGQGEKIVRAEQGSGANRKELVRRTHFPAVLQEKHCKAFENGGYSMKIDGEGWKTPDGMWRSSTAESKHTVYSCFDHKLTGGVLSAYTYPAMNIDDASWN